MEAEHPGHYRGRSLGIFSSQYWKRLCIHVVGTETLLRS